MRLSYRFGWSGIQAATADIHFFSPTRNTFEVDASGATSGFPRTLFRLDIYHQATENKDTLMPIHFFQEEKYRQETVKTNVDFEPDHVTGLREKIPSDHPSKPNVFKFSPVFDLTTALLWVRSQPLADGDTESTGSLGLERSLSRHGNGHRPGHNQNRRAKAKCDQARSQAQKDRQEDAIERSQIVQGRPRLAL